MTVLTPLDFWRAGMGVWLSTLRWQAEFGQLLLAVARSEVAVPETSLPARSGQRRVRRV